MEAIFAHREFLHRDGGRHLARLLAPRLRQELLDLILQGIKDAILPRLLADVSLEQVLTEIAARQTDPYSVADAIVGRLAGKV